MRTLSEILIEVDKNPTLENKGTAWKELTKNKYKYSLSQLEFAKEYLWGLKTKEPSIKAGVCDCNNSSLSDRDFTIINPGSFDNPPGYHTPFGLNDENRKEITERTAKRMLKNIKSINKSLKLNLLRRILNWFMK